jgi:hypothetical protein
MNFGSAALPVAHHEPVIPFEFSEAVIPDAGPVWAIFGPSNSGTVVQLRATVFFAERLLSSVGVIGFLTMASKK